MQLVSLITVSTLNLLLFIKVILAISDPFHFYMDIDMNFSNSINKSALLIVFVVVVSEL